MKFTILEPIFTLLRGEAPMCQVRWNALGYVEAPDAETALVKAKRLGYRLPIVEPTSTPTSVH